MSLAYSSENLPRGVLLHIRGEVDLASARDLEDQLLHHLDQGHDVIADFSDVSYFDMSGVHVFERCSGIFREKHRALVIVDASPVVQKVFRIIGFSAVSVAMNKEEALALLRGIDHGE